ncbi:hypothetical protein PRIPAC_85089 [Pristionchus pacificus]|uniref:Protein kinase domain-containing protein n=1 Tax=Pristionchus pacificus TaxID=54126 RepID=A0A2A6BUY5_PRIPA|nr:hypothetical protein PRIPAC_85089 [Pristionchus pacificus]|eukprot:PDM69730.1 protein kinase [Pristionchus pacificus]
MVEASQLVGLLSLISVTSSIILTGTVICDKDGISNTANLNATLIIGTIKDKKLHDNGQHVMMLNYKYWTEYLLRVETTKSWVFQDEVSLQIRIVHNCESGDTPEEPKCIYLNKKSDFNVVRTHIRLGDDGTKSDDTMALDAPVPASGGTDQGTGAKQTTGDEKYTVVKLLGSGGFGDVYLVEDDISKAKYALKTEFYGAVKTLFSRLKIEAHVLDKCTKAPEKARKHFLTLRDKGTTADFKFICMDVVGPSLESVRKKYSDKGEFSKGTALNVSKRTLQSIWDLHSLGFLHRDIKPANFSIGLGPEQETCIFMLDFGIAREFKNPNGTLRKPREGIPFLGTPRFASRACHKKEEQSPKDDVEVWIYMVYDLFDIMNGIPWKGQTDRPAILKMKDEMMTGKKLPTKRCPKQFLQVVTYIGKLEYVDTPDYAWMMSVCDSMAKELKVNTADNAVDWAGKVNGPSKNAGSNEKNDSEKTCSGEEETNGNADKQTGGIFGLFRKKKSATQKTTKGGTSPHDTAK